MSRLLYGFLFRGYRLKILLYRCLIGKEALSHVLYYSLFPEVVLKIGGATIGNGTRVSRWLTIHESRGSFGGLSIGDNVHIGKHVFIDLADRVTIKDRAGIGMFSKIITHRHYGDSQLKRRLSTIRKAVVIGQDTVLCANAILLAGTELGSMCHVLPNSVVQGSYSDGVTLVGNPARTSIRAAKCAN
jgi:acetyltransferase-like isoleucine patch superfamily enzyme